MARFDGAVTNALGTLGALTNKDIKYPVFTNDTLNFKNPGLRSGADAFGVKEAFTFKPQELPKTATKEFTWK